LCCESKKNKTGKHVDRDLTDDLMKLEEKLDEAVKMSASTKDEIDEIISEENQISSATSAS